MRKPNLTPAEIADKIHYNPATGVFRHRKSSAKCRAYEKAGRMVGRNLYLSYAGTSWKASQTAYYLETGDWGDIEFKDGNPENLCFSNLQMEKYSDRPSGAPLVVFNAYVYYDRIEISSDLPDEYIDRIKAVLNEFQASV